MKTPKFNDNQCVKIENKEQFDEIYHLMKSAELGISLEDWLKKYSYPLFPIYLCYANSVTRGKFIGYNRNPKNVWTGEDYEILSLEEACN